VSSRREFVKISAAIPVAIALKASADTPVMICWQKEEGEIDGFGASGAFHMAQNLRNFPEQTRKQILDLLFSPVEGIGLSALRNIVGDGGSWGTRLNGPTPSIEPKEGIWNWTGDEEQIWLMKEAASRGCTRYMSTVWSPPAWMKTNGDVIKGRVREDKYQAFAEYLSAYVRGYKEHHGIEIYAISPTNEPEITVDYSSCYWDGEELHEFVRDHLVPTFDRDAVKTKLILGEHSTWSEEPALPSLNDPVTAPRIDIVGVHSYVDSRGNPFPPISARTGRLETCSKMIKRIWMTEVSDGGPNITEIQDGLYWAKLLHTHLVEDSVNAWFYWWAISNIDDRSALIYLNTDNHTYVVPSRLYTIGHYSRFVRPGYIRLHVTSPSQPGVYLSAYKPRDNSRLVVVAINESGTDCVVQMEIEGAVIASLEVFRTSAKENLQAFGRTPTSGHTLNLSLCGFSITTFVGAAQPH
jgi:glucuronoarabinoxylan endo-1,4-beta-xylanase